MSKKLIWRREGARIVWHEEKNPSQPLMRRARWWLLKKLIGNRSVVANVRLKGGSLYFNEVPGGMAHSVVYEPQK